MSLVGIPLEDIIMTLTELKEIEAISMAVCPHPITQRRMDALNDTLVLLEFLKKQYNL